MTGQKSCPQCGQSNDITAMFCRNCGQNLVLIAETEPAPNMRRRGLIALATYLTIVAVLLAFAWFILWPRLQPVGKAPAANFEEIVETLPATPVSLISQAEGGIDISTPTASTLPPPTETAMPTITSTPVNTATLLPTPTKTIAPTNTPTNPPTPAPSPLPAADPIVHKPLTGDSLVQLTFDEVPHYTPSLSPDQQRLILSAEIDGYWQILAIDPNGAGLVRQITQSSANFHQPQFSADGRTILVGSDLDGDMDIYLLDSETGEVVQQITNNPGDEYYPNWLPDGSGFVFSTQQDGNDDVYLGRFDGTQVQLTDSVGFDGFATVSPDGEKIVFCSKRDDDYEIYMMDIDGHNPQRLTLSPGRDASPVFSPDGDWIVFESERNDNYDIFAMRVDGSDLRQLTDHLAGDWIPKFAPDGLWLLFQSDRNGNMDIFRVPFLSRSLYLNDPYMTGEDVSMLQQKLFDLGYTQVGDIDGIFGSLTEEAVRAYQQDSGLDVDGVAGPVTWAKLFD